MSNLTEHFSIAELEHSTTAKRLGIQNSAPPTVVWNATALATHVLEKVRAHFGKPVRINSWYRSPAVNRAVGGAVKSLHLTGCAADIEVLGVSNYALAVWIRDHCDFDELILENYLPGMPASGWVHVAYNGMKRVQTRRVLTQLPKGKRWRGKRYLPGLIKE